MGHISPTDGKVITIYHPVSSGKNIIDPIEALACDGTNTNVGAEGGINHLIEISIGVLYIGMFPFSMQTNCH